MEDGADEGWRGLAAMGALLWLILSMGAAGLAKGVLVHTCNHLSHRLCRKISSNFAKHIANPFKPILCAQFVFNCTFQHIPDKLAALCGHRGFLSAGEAREDSTASQDSSWWLPTHFTFDFGGKV